MHTKLIATLAALAFAFTAGTASAAEPFSALGDVSAQPLTAEEMDAIRGATGQPIQIIIDTRVPGVVFSNLSSPGPAPRGPRGASP